MSTEDFRERIGTAKADLLVGDDGRDLIIGKRGRDVLIGEGGDDRLEGDHGNDILRGGRGDDLLAGGRGLDTYQWNRGDMDAGTLDRIFDDKGSRLQFDEVLLEQLTIDGKTLDSIKGRKVVGSEIDAGNSIAYRDGALLIDLDGDGVFCATQDARIEIVGNSGKVVFTGGNDLFTLS